MKKILFLLTILFSISSFSQKDITLKEYTHSEFFRMIKEEPSDTLNLKNAAIVFDTITDQPYSQILDLNLEQTENFRKDTLIIDKILILENIYFVPFSVNDAIKYGYFEKKKIKQGGIYTINFKEKVILKNFKGSFDGVVFQKGVQVEFDSIFNKVNIAARKYRMGQGLNFEKSRFKKGIHVFSRGSAMEENELINTRISIEECEFWPLDRTEYAGRTSAFYINKIEFFKINQSIFYGTGPVEIYGGNTRGVTINENDFKNNGLNISIARNEAIENLSFVSNRINRPTILDIGQLKSENRIDWSQFKKGVFQSSILSNYIKTKYNRKGFVNQELRKQDSIKNEFLEKGVYRYKPLFKKQTLFYEKYKSHYNNQHDKEFENLVFLDIKNLETKRLGYLYQQNPSFDTFFTWKINQFLKVFSAYGTKPSKAVTFSLYVILLFAFIYLLFPNSWDAHGRKRIMNRYAFFFTYMNKKSGIHEVYLDNQKEELLEFNEFKTLVEQQGKTVPKFFTATALPLYKWSISGTKISSSFLSKIDIMKGTWNDLPKSKRIWKAILLIGAFLIAIIYDILIKMLNALMLSINTFTTLGFGEIPIKGLPRYLAIIQGFIGWFMLTIFSVSLISQLLN